MPSHILIVDDEQHIRDVLAESLTTAGYTVSQAESGEKGLELIRTNPPDLMIVDLKMPGISGLDFLHKATPLVPDAESVILTGFGDMPSAVEALRLGAYDYLTKPVDLERLIQTLKNADDRRGLAMENRDLVRRLKEANQLKADFINGMSHEVRTPLGHITGFTQILQDTLENLTDKQKRYLQNIHDGAEKLLTMFENILQFSALKTADVDLRLEEVPLAGLLADALDGVRSLAIERNIDLAFEGDPSGTIVAERVTVAKMLTLLLDNAIKFTDPGGSVTLRTEVKAATDEPAGLDDHGPAGDVTGWLYIHVADTGIGIAEEDHRQIFNLFEQAESGLDRRYEGTGIGLPLALSLARFHGGTILLQSEVGKGSTFTVAIPLMAL